MHVYCACIPPVSTQDSGEFYNKSFTASSQGCIITVVTTVSKHTWTLSHVLSLVCFAETLDIL